MATVSYTTYHCPRCGQSLSLWMRLITKPSINCSGCGQPFNVSRELLEKNWATAFYVRAVVVIWIITIVCLLASPDPKLQNHPLPVKLLGSLIVGWIPGMVFAVPFLFIGMIGAWIYGRRFERPASTTSDPAHRGPVFVPRDDDWR